MPKKLRDYLFPLGQGAKIYPQDLVGGNVGFGNVFYVKGSGGSDSNDGTTPETALATISEAHDRCTANQNDAVFLIAGNSASGAAANETAAVTWSKGFTHLIGIASPVITAGRARVVQTTADVSPSITVSGNGCIISNVQLGVFVDANVNVKVTGDRNYFEGVHFAGIGHATAGDDAAARSLWLSGADENRFVNCTIGLDTVERSTTNAELEVSDASTRNVFEDCTFLSIADNAGHLFVKAASAASIDRYLTFKRCMFHNAVLSTSTTLTTAMSLHAAVGGSVILDGCSVLGVTDWSDYYTALRGCNMPDITAANSGFMETITT